MPNGVPESVYFSILGNVDNYFGMLSQNSCDGVVKLGVADCKAQVKAAYKCGVKTANSHYSILLKQCAQLTNALDRADCKDGAKTQRDLNRASYQDAMEDPNSGGLVQCTGVFVDALNGACMDIVSKVGAP